MPEMTYRQALHDALREEMQRDPNVFLLGEEIGIFGGSYKVTEGLIDEFGPQRVLETPISEGGIIGLATGASMTGLRPVAEIMTINFIVVGMDQLVNNAAKIPYMFGGEAKAPIVIRTPSGAGHQLASQHSQVLESWFAYVPGMYVIAPSTPADAKGLLKASIRDDNPILFVENVLLYNEKGEVPEGEHILPLGKADVKREGEDITLIAYSRAVHMALAAADALAEQGISAEVVDLRSLRPLDIETVVSSVRKTNHAIVLHEGWKRYGAGAEIAAEIQEHAFDDLDHPVERITGAEVPLPYATSLERAALPRVEDVVMRAAFILGRDKVGV
ncbi:MAG TPA: alpha-ketoacid dehydrogenase subunit beta [Chloroflexota bacterium]|nr:alpha-ketoacid dehydrogenase subunit beta [Chloroflexota bacterium]